MNQSFKHQHENTKHQVPNTKEFRSSKSQFCPRRRRLGACDLKFFWSLELGVWCLDFDVWDFVLGPVGPPDSLTRHRAVADLHCHQKSGPTLSDMAVKQESNAVDAEFYAAADAFFTAHRNLALTYDAVTLRTLYSEILS